ncbi:MAG: hypothetical protein HY827_02470 [Actinobacteria bacterium]|nr:hypothetical protein [Actinomycetota bacterium]
MKVAVDAGVMLVAYAGEGAAQRECADAIEAVLAEDVLVVTAAEMAGFVDLITDNGHFENPPELVDVAALCNDYASAANVEIAENQADDLVAALALLREHGLPATKLGAALQAASLRRLGVEQLLTLEPPLYAEFKFVRALSPGR